MRLFNRRGTGLRRNGRWRGLGVLTMSVPILLWLAALPAAAESRTAESIWSQSDAQRQALDQIPLADRDGVSQTRCQEVGVGRMGGLPRFRCTVWFTPGAAGEPGTPGAAGGAGSREP
jgi:hypothetical protein